METTYRGYEIKKGTSGYWIYKDIQQVSEVAFASEDAACNEIDKWKKQQAAAKQAAAHT